MKLWELPWDTFFDQLAQYRLLSEPARRALAVVVRTSGYTPIADAAKMRQEDELTESTPDGANWRCAVATPPPSPPALPVMPH